METTTTAHAGGANDLVQLDRDHPGFRDASYRARRNAIARLALDYQEGEPVPVASYTPEEHAVWRLVWRELTPLHEELACRDYQDCSRGLALERGGIPQLRDVNPRIMESTGFSMLPVAGLVSARTFLVYLGRSIFLATQYIRHHSRPLYTPEPDVVHELVGHASTFVHPEFARISRGFGDAAARADAEAVERIARVYWYTLEFGAVEEDGIVKAYGAGLLSSAGELSRLKAPPKDVTLAPMDLDRMAETPYDPTDFQKHYYVAPSFATMIDTVSDWLEAL